jgi:RNA recognition motif-containing protein
MMPAIDSTHRDFYSFFYYVIDLTEGDIKDLVSEHVEVKSVKLPRDKVSNNGRGFCFVEVESDEDVEKAISALDGVESAGRRIRVSKSVPKDQVEKTVKPETRNRNPDTPKTPEGYGKIYVSNLPYEITNEELTDLFGEYGEVLEVYVPVNRMKNTGRGFAFVTMKEEDIANAIEQTHGKEVQGRPITSSIPLPPGEKTAKPRRSNTQCKLYIGNLSFYTTEDTLKELFEEFGTVSDCYVPLDLNRGGTSSRGFAFITMERNDAMVALAELDGCELDGRNIQVNEAQPKTPREPRE